MTGPDVLDKLNADALVDTYADLLGTPPNLVLADDELAAKRQARQQQQQQMQAMAMARQGAEAAAKGTQAMKNILPQNQEQADVLAALQDRGGL